MATDQKQLPGSRNFENDRNTFYIGVVLLALLGTFVLITDVFLNKKFSPISYEIIKVILAVSCTLVLSQLPNVLNIDLPLGIKAAGGIAFGILIYFYSPNFLQNKPEEQSVSVPKVKNRKIKIVILQSGSYEYANTISYSFYNKLRDSLGITDFDLEIPSVLTGVNDSYDEPNVQVDYSNKVKEIFSRAPYNYYITIGSAASIALSHYIKAHNLKEVKQIFLGVTDPVLLGLCNSLSENRNDEQHRNIAGVAYCGNYEDLPNKIFNLFPSKKLCYIYNTSIIEDGHLAQRFLQTDLARSNTLIIKPINRKLVKGDFLDTNFVYFSWSTFDDAFANDFSLINDNSYVVSTTSTHSKYGLVPIAVTTNDELIGQKGAEILLANLLGRKPLEEIDIFIPPWKSYINTRLAIRKYNLAEDLIEKCDIKYQ
jgi:hypothetical protein